MPACRIIRSLRLVLVITAGAASAALASAQVTRPPAVVANVVMRPLAGAANLASRPPAGTANAPSVQRTVLSAPVVLPPPVKLAPPVTCGRGGKVSVTPC